jgi:hypothetical protein
MKDPGHFYDIKDKKGFWTLDKMKVHFDGFGSKYPEPTTGEACFSDSYRGMIGIKNLADYKKQLFTDACGGPTFEDCKNSFDPAKLPKVTITLLSDSSLRPLIAKGEDYMAWVWNEGKPSSQKIDDYVLAIESFTATYDDCPPSATIIFGRLFTAKFTTTFRAAANGDRMIAIAGQGSSQFSPMDPLVWVLIFMFGIFAIMLISILIAIVCVVSYFVNKHKRAKAIALN